MLKNNIFLKKKLENIYFIKNSNLKCKKKIKVIHLNKRIFSKLTLKNCQKKINKKIYYIKDVFLKKYFLKNKHLLKKRINKNKILNTRYFIKRVFIKPAFFKNFKKPETLFYFKKLVFFIVSYYKFKRNELFKLFKKQKNINREKYIQINWLKEKDILLFKQMLFYIKNKKTNTLAFYKQQKLFFFFLLKHKVHLFRKKPREYIKKIFLSSFKKSLKQILIKKDFLINYKKCISLLRVKKSKVNKSTLLYNKLVGLLIKKGVKQKALRILEDALLEVKKTTKITPNLILFKIFNSLKTSVESKKIRVRRSFHIVPFPIKTNRKLFLISKWILTGTTKQRLKKSFGNKLALELLKILGNKKAFSSKFKKYNVSKSLQNKSNIHFRWKNS